MTLKPGPDLNGGENLKSMEYGDGLCKIKH